MSRLLRLCVAACACVCALQPGNAAADNGPSNPKTCDVGAYLISLHDFDMAKHTFGADFWIWSTCPAKDLRPLEVMDFVNAVSLETRLASTLDRKGVTWSYVKVSGIFRHEWNVTKYPFDRHALRVLIENTNAPASEFAFRADREGSQASRDLVLDGWRVTGFAIRDEIYVYDTTFGDPAFAGKKQSDYSRLEIAVGVERARRFSFVTLVAAVYIAFALSALAFLLGPYNGRRRANLLAGTLFAVVVNQRVAESVIGRSEHVTLVDQIHIVAMLWIFGIALAGIQAQRLFDGGAQDKATRWDRHGLWVTCVSYVAVNVVLVGVAALL
jgi:hypothetical protein